MNSDFTKCAACKQNFDAVNRFPKTLPCQHNYCPQCLNNLVRGPQSIDCDICRVNHRLNPEDVPVNHILIQQLNPPTQPNLQANHNNSQNWDESAYFKKIFDEMDHNHDGQISGQELHKALRKGQENSEFDTYTVNVLLRKYDADKDNEINFSEFYQLFMEINQLFNEFLDIDLDFSGSIDRRELSNALQRKGFQFSPDFYNWLFFELGKLNGKEQISFDIYVRVIAKISKMKFDFKNMPQNQNNNDPNQLEQFCRQYFFYNN